MLSKNIQAPNIQLVTVPAGEFIMGRLDGFSHGGREDPAHKVILAEYQIGRYPITNAEYRLFAQDTGHKFTDGQDDQPASGLTWQDAWLFCAWMRYKTGQPYHLPTEAEWEKAATWNPKTNKNSLFLGALKRLINTATYSPQVIREPPPSVCIRRKAIALMVVPI